MAILGLVSKIGGCLIEPPICVQALERGGGTRSSEAQQGGHRGCLNCFHAGRVVGYGNNFKWLAGNFLGNITGEVEIFCAIKDGGLETAPTWGDSSKEVTHVHFSISYRNR